MSCVNDAAVEGTPVQASDPEYTLRWPHEVVLTELADLIARAEQEGVGPAWNEEVETLLRQAFPSDAPVRAFRRVAAKSALSRNAARDEEPF